MAAPAYVNAGTGVQIASGSGACTLAGTTAGNTIVLQVLQDGTAASAVTLSAITNLENLADTASALTTLAAAQPVGSPTAALQHLYIGRSLGGTVSVTVATTGDDLYYCLYEFSGALAGTTLAAVTESIANGVGTGTTVSDTGVTTTAADRLALQFVAVNDDLAVGPFTGATGGSWLEPVAEFASATGTDGCIQLQIGPLSLDYFHSLTSVSASPVGSGSASQEMAQQFTAPSTETLSAAWLGLGKQGSPADNVSVEIQTDASNKPSGTRVGSAVVIPGASLSIGTLGPRAASGLEAPVTSGIKYWLVVRRTGALDAANYFTWRAHATPLYASHLYGQKGSVTWTTFATGTQSFGLFRGAAGTINGGTFAMVSGGWGVIGLALIPVASGTAHTSSPADTLALADAVAKAAGLGLADTLALADAFARVTTTARAVADTVALADATTRAKAIAKSITDSVALTDSAAAAKGKSAAISDTVALADSASSSKTIPKSVADSLVLTDARAIAQGQVVTDSLVLADATTRAKTIPKTVADSLVLADSASPVKTIGGVSHAVPIADTVALTDSAAPVKTTGATAHTRSITDSVALADTTARAKAAQKALADTLALADAFARVTAASRTVTDSVALADAAGRAATVARALADTIALTDSLAAAKGRAVTVADTVQVSDAVSVHQDVSLAHTRTIADVVAVTDQADPDHHLGGAHAGYIDFPGIGTITRPAGGRPATTGRGRIDTPDPGRLVTTGGGR